MVVVSIVGILSAIALPSFLNQTAKAKGTECAQKAVSVLRQASAESALSEDKADALASSLATSESTKNCTITLVGDGIDENGVIAVDVTGKEELELKYAAKACINTLTSESEYEYTIGDGTNIEDPADVACGVTTSE